MLPLFQKFQTLHILQLQCGYLIFSLGDIEAGLIVYILQLDGDLRVVDVRVALFDIGPIVMRDRQRHWWSKLWSLHIDVDVALLIVDSFIFVVDLLVGVTHVHVSHFLHVFPEWCNEFAELLFQFSESLY